MCFLLLIRQCKSKLQLFTHFQSIVGKNGVESILKAITNNKSDIEPLQVFLPLLKWQLPNEKYTLEDLCTYFNKFLDKSYKIHKQKKWFWSYLFLVLLPTKNLYRKKIIHWVALGFWIIPVKDLFDSPAILLYGPFQIYLQTWKDLVRLDLACPSTYIFFIQTQSIFQVLQTSEML